jgi:hypothetical protein
MQPDFEAGSWVVAGSGGKKYIGKLVKGDDGWIELKEAIELVVMIMPISTPQGPALNRIVTCQPIDACNGPTNIRVKHDYLQYFEDMSTDDRSRHKSVVTDAVGQMTASRARESGLVLPPGGLRVRPG